MLNSFATLEDVRILAQYFAKALPEEALEASKGVCTSARS